MMTFYGSGSVYIPVKHSFIRFVGGAYSTDDADVISVLSRKYQSSGRIEQSIEPEIIDDELETVDKPRRGRKPKNVS